MPETTAVERRDWWSRAACRAADPELFFPISTLGPAAEQTARAKAVCADCAVRRPCLDFAMMTGQRHGIWGGADEKERETLTRSRRQAWATHRTAAKAPRWARPSSDPD